MANIGDCGAVLEYSLNGGVDYIELADVASMQPPPVTVAKGDKTRIADDCFRTTHPGRIEWGQMRATLYFDKAEAAVLYGLAGLEETFRITLKPQTGEVVEGSNWVFPGFIDEIAPHELSKDNDDPHMYDITIQSQGITFTPGT